MTGLSEEIVKEIQAIFRNSPTLLIGSGFSCGFGLPGMSELGDYLCKVVEPRLTSPNSIDLWNGSLAAIKANLEDGLNTIPIAAPGREELLAILREETAKLIIDRTLVAESSIISDVNASGLAPIRLLKRLFNGVPQNADGISVITTNYDTLLELFCDMARLPLDTGFSGFRRRTLQAPLFQTYYSRNRAPVKSGYQVDHRPVRSIKLLKPHGSITWHVTPDGAMEVINDYTRTPNALVIPGPSKYQDALVNIVFDAVRTEMNNIFGRASALFCIGFGFNDDHLQGMIKSRLDAGMPMIVITYQWTENAKLFLKSYPHVIAFECNGSGALCHYQGELYTVANPLWQLEEFLKSFLE